MKGRKIQLALYVLLGVATAACLFVLFGCSSTSDSVFVAPDERLVPFTIPVPPAELTCRTPGDLQHRALTREEVEADGSVMFQATTADILALLDIVWQNYNECVASNEARQLVIQAAAEAQERLEAMLAESD